MVDAPGAVVDRELEACDILVSANHGPHLHRIAICITDFFTGLSTIWRRRIT